MKAALHRLYHRAASLLFRHGLDAVDEALAHRRDEDVLLAAALARDPAALTLTDPVAYVAFVRSCLERARCVIREIKGADDDTDLPARRFGTLLRELAADLPPTDLATAQDLGHYGDEFLAMREPVEWGRWAGDVGAEYRLGSANGKKGRILLAAIRRTGSRRCVEIGTFYGLGACFIASTLRAAGPGAHVATIEASESRLARARDRLRTRYGELVSCHRGLSHDVLPTLLSSLAPVDFVFHDASHSRDAYVRDFELLAAGLPPGAVVLFDDIRWEDERRAGASAQTYAGWTAVVAHARVRRAAELDRNMGILLLT